MIEYWDYWFSSISSSLRLGIKYGVKCPSICLRVFAELMYDCTSISRSINNLYWRNDESRFSIMPHHRKQHTGGFLW